MPAAPSSHQTTASPLVGVLTRNAVWTDDAVIPSYLALLTHAAAPPSASFSRRIDPEAIAAPVW